MFDAIAADYYEIISTVAAAGTWGVDREDLAGAGNRVARARAGDEFGAAENCSELLEVGLCASRVFPTCSRVSTTYVGGSARVRWFSGMSEARQ
jgi:hypothetical protein